MPFHITILILSLLAIASPAHALHFHVNPTTGDDRRSVQSAQDPSTPFKTIEHALRIAHLVTEGRPHVIELPAGTYSPSTGVAFPLTISQPGIYIKTNGLTIFDAEGKSNFFNITGKTSNFTIQGIDFYNGVAEKGGVAYCNTCSLRVTNNRFFKNRSTSGGHVVYTENGHLKFYNNLVRDSGSEADTLAVLELRNTFTDTTVRDEIRNNTFYRNPSTNIWTASPRTYISSNIFFDPQREVIRDASASATPLIDHNIFWETEVLYISDKRDSIKVQRTVRDTLTLAKAGIKLPSAMTNSPNVRSLTFRGDTLSLAQLNVRIPPFVTNHPDTLIQVGRTHQYLVSVSGQTNQYQFRALQLPTGARLDNVSGVPRLVIWNPTINDTTSHPIRLQITDPSGTVDTLSYNLDVHNVLPDTTGFRAYRDASGRFAGMYRETQTIEVPHTTGQPYRFDIQVSSNKSLYFFRPLQLPSGASTSLAGQGIIDWTPTAADTGRSRIEMLITNPVGNLDTLRYGIYVFTPQTFPDTATTGLLITSTLVPDTTAAINALNALTPTFSAAASAVGNLYANPAFLDTAINRFELIVGSSAGIDKGSPIVSLLDANKSANDMGFLGGPGNTGPPSPDTTSFSEVKVTTLPDSVVTEGQTFVYNPALSPNATIDLIDLITSVPGSSLPATMGPYSPFGQAPPIRWTPTLADTGSYLIGVRVITPTSSGRHYFPLRVRPLNEIPVITSLADTTALEDQPYAYTIRASDANGDTLTYALVTGPNGLTVNANSGAVEWTPTQNLVGRHAVSIRVDDGKGGVSLHNYTLVVSNANDPPTILSSPDTTATEDAPFSYAVSASDADVVDTLSYALTEAPAGAVIDSAGVLTWTPTQSQVGAQRFVITATDRSNAVATQRFSVQVSAFDDVPVIAAIPDTSAREDSAYALNMQASDEEGGALAYALLQGPTGMAIDSTGVLTWMPAAADVGSHPVVATATDPSGQTARLSFTLNVLAVNDAPQIKAQSPGDARVFNPAGGTVSFAVSASDEEGDALNFSWLVNGVVQANASDSSFSYAPPATQFDSVTVRVADASDTTRFTWQLDSRQIPRLALDVARADFGNVAIGDTARTPISVANSGETTLLISSLQVSDLRFAATFGAISIDPGQRTELVLSYVPTARGANADTIRFASNDPDNAGVAIPVAGTGTVATTVSFDLDPAVGDQGLVGRSAKAGDTLHVALYAQKAAALQSYDLHLGFVPDALRFVSFAPSGANESNILGAQGATVAHTAQLISDSTLAINVAIATGSVTGSGLLGISIFAVDSGAPSAPTALSIRRAVLKSLNVSAADTLTAAPRATINLRPALIGDFDLDGDVDFSDFFLFSDNFGQPNFNPLTDLDADGAVTFSDFFLFSDNFGRSIAGKRVVETVELASSDLRMRIAHSQPEQLTLAPYWQGDTPPRGYVLALSFDPQTLQFDQYIARAEQAPLPWIVESAPGQLTLATGLGRTQRAFDGDDLGQLVFARIARTGTQVRATAAMSYTGQQVRALALPSPLRISALPETFALYPAHPNPFNPDTSIPFYVPERAEVSLRVYDLLGRSVYTLLSGSIDPGYHSAVWRGIDTDGRPVGSGVYLVEMRAPGWRQISKVMLLK